MLSPQQNFITLYIVVSTGNQAEQHIFLGNLKISTFLKKLELQTLQNNRYSENWNFMFTQLFLKSCFIFHEKCKIFTILKCHTIFDHVH